MRLFDYISYEALEFTFSDEGEVLERDISAVHVVAILSCKDKLLDLTVDAFGAGGVDTLPIYTVQIPVVSGDIISTPFISPLFVTKMFDMNILQLFSDKGLSILWNPEWLTNAEIDPIFPDSSMKLVPEEQ